LIFLTINLVFFKSPHMDFFLKRNPQGPSVLGKHRCVTLLFFLVLAFFFLLSSSSFFLLLSSAFLLLLLFWKKVQFPPACVVWCAVVGLRPNNSEKGEEETSKDKHDRICERSALLDLFSSLFSLSLSLFLSSSSSILLFFYSSILLFFYSSILLFFYSNATCGA